jgi:hypothetical protein
MASTALAYGFPLTRDYPFTDQLKASAGDFRTLLAATKDVHLIPEGDGTGPLDAVSAHYNTGIIGFLNALSGYGCARVEMCGDLNRPSFYVIGVTPQLETLDGGVFTPVNPQDLLNLVTPQVTDNMKRLCADLGLDYGEPTWLLVDSWIDDEPTEVE